jgi:hypothetical protein
MSRLSRDKGLRNLARQAIERHLSAHQIAVLKAAEESECALIRRFVETMTAR